MEWTNGGRLLVSELSAGSIQDLRLELDRRGVLDVMSASKYSNPYLKAGNDAPQLADDILRAIASPLDLGARAYR